METIEKGEITQNKSVKTGYLPQVPPFHAEGTIIEHIFKGTDEKVQLIKRYEEVCEELAHETSPQLQKELEEIMHKIDEMDVWMYENQIRSILDQLGIDNLKLKMNTLSGGMLKKVALAQVLVSDANFLILDEPTNHLDLETINWLEEYLKKNVKTLMLVTHDRYFLDRVCNLILEIEDQKLYRYTGNDNYYLEKKSEIINDAEREQERINSILRKELKWLKAGVKARGTKQNARKKNIEELQKNKKSKSSEQLEFSTFFC